MKNTISFELPKGKRQISHSKQPSKQLNLPDPQKTNSTYQQISNNALKSSIKILQERLSINIGQKFLRSQQKKKRNNSNHQNSFKKNSTTISQYPDYLIPKKRANTRNRASSNKGGQISLKPRASYLYQQQYSQNNSCSLSNQLLDNQKAQKKMKLHSSLNCSNDSKGKKKSLAKNSQELQGNTKNPSFLKFSKKPSKIFQDSLKNQNFQFRHDKFNKGQKFVNLAQTSKGKLLNLFNQSCLSKKKNMSTNSVNKVEGSNFQHMNAQNVSIDQYNYTQIQINSSLKDKVQPLQKKNKSDTIKEKQNSRSAQQQFIKQFDELLQKYIEKHESAKQPAQFSDLHAIFNSLFEYFAVPSIKHFGNFIQKQLSQLSIANNCTALQVKHQLKQIADLEIENRKLEQNFKEFQEQAIKNEAELVRIFEDQQNTIIMLKDKEGKLITLLKAVKKLGINLEKIFQEQILNQQYKPEEGDIKESSSIKDQFEETKIYNGLQRTSKHVNQLEKEIGPSFMADISLINESNESSFNFWGKTVSQNQSESVLESRIQQSQQQKQGKQIAQKIKDKLMIDLDNVYQSVTESIESSEVKNQITIDDKSSILSSKVKMIEDLKLWADQINNKFKK